MHEHGLLKHLMHKIDEVVRRENAARATRIVIKPGAFCTISPDRFRAHFDDAKAGPTAEHAELDVYTCEDHADPLAGQIVLESLEVEEARRRG